MELSIVGSGYVGLVAGACFADSGNRVICVDNAPEKISRLKDGEIPIYEPGLEQVVERNVAAGRLAFTTELDRSITGSRASSGRASANLPRA